MTEDNKLAVTGSMSRFTKKVGIQGARDAAKQALSKVKPEECVNRYAIGFDDSGSMSGDAINDAKKAVAGFLGSCNPLDTSVAIHPFCHHQNQGLTNLYDLINMYLGPIRATGGTPLFEKMIEMMQTNPITRGILFSDGGAGDGSLDEDRKDADLEFGSTTWKDWQAIKLSVDRKIPFDCVAVGDDSEVLRKIAKLTGGIYLRFTDTSIFAKQMKYLSPKYVALLANADLKARIERGEAI